MLLRWARRCGCRQHCAQAAGLGMQGQLRDLQDGSSTYASHACPGRWQGGALELCELTVCLVRPGAHLRCCSTGLGVVGADSVVLRLLDGG